MGGKVKKPRKPRKLKLSGALAEIEKLGYSNLPYGIWLLAWGDHIGTYEARRLANWLLKAAEYLESKEMSE
jgi:hypothetical protein